LAKADQRSAIENQPIDLTTEDLERLRRNRAGFSGCRKDRREVGRVIPNAPFRMAARPEAAD
jgi:hypothetical protein